MIEVQKEIMEDSIAWFPDKAVDLLYNVLCLNGEAGEVANMLKKIERGDIVYDASAVYAIAMELADTYIYLLQCSNILGVNIVEAYKEKRKINLERFGRPSTGLIVPNEESESGIRRVDFSKASGRKHPSDEHRSNDESPRSTS